MIIIILNCHYGILKVTFKGFENFREMISFNVP